MRSRRTPSSNEVYRLPGGTEDNDLHVRVGRGLEGMDPSDPASRLPYIASVWEPNPDERARLSAGANVELVIWGDTVPPVAVGVTDEQPLSRAQSAVDGPGPYLWTQLHGALVVDLIDTLSARLAEPDLPAGVVERLAEMLGVLDRGLVVLARQRSEGPPA